MKKMHIYAGLGAALLALSAAACGSEELPVGAAGASPTPDPTVTTRPTPDAAVPPAPDAAVPPAPDAAVPPVDASVADTAPSVDAAPDAPVIVDAAPVDAGAVGSTLRISTLSENCMPIVAKDPIRLVGTVDVANNTPATVGPITATTGEIRDLAGNLRTSFDLLAPLSTGTILSGQSVSRAIEKRPASAVPALQCATLACNTEVVVSLRLSGPGVAAGTVVKSAPVRVSCTF